MIGKIKNYYKENYNNWLILGIILSIGYFFIFYMTPMRLDDLTWEAILAYNVFKIGLMDTMDAMWVILLLLL